jgi:FMN phosphatase YigB (HAD superfamily)
MATLIFDFDDTLFDTARLKKDLFTMIAAHRVSDDDILRSYAESQSSGNYSFHDHVSFLNTKYGASIPDRIFEDFNQLPFESYLFPYTRKTLETLSKDNTLMLLTKGDPEFQSMKVKGSNIESYFKEVYITPLSKEIFLKDMSLTPPFYFINDKDSENEIIQRMFPDVHVLKATTRTEEIFSLVQ